MWNILAALLISIAALGVLSFAGVSIIQAISQRGGRDVATVAALVVGIGAPLAGSGIGLLLRRFFKIGLTP